MDGGWVLGCSPRPPSAAAQPRFTLSRGLPAPSQAFGFCLVRSLPSCASYSSTSTRCHPSCCSCVSGTPRGPWGGNDLALYRCSLSFPRRGRFCSLMAAGTAGGTRAGRAASHRTGGWWVLPAPAASPAGTQTPLTVSVAAPLRLLLLGPLPSPSSSSSNFIFLAALHPPGFCVRFRQIQGGPGTKFTRHRRGLQRPTWVLLGVG